MTHNVHHHLASILISLEQQKGFTAMSRASYDISLLILEGLPYEHDSRTLPGTAGIE